ncbi:hypothetical protein TNCV_1076821 [Trichonephila clavipes]|uniref:Uncharacterized protein n=1 Tax=Trichonephila clavipes TaxID=2585209 RepID=A0A8X6RTN4_TRICX|nr:hypothetical protein TNCV_1076821 [Trichonephila clavipes]
MLLNRSLLLPLKIFFGSHLSPEELAQFSQIWLLRFGPKLHLKMLFRLKNVDCFTLKRANTVSDWKETCYDISATKHCSREDPV